MIAYKVFNPDWTCRGFQYQVGETYKDCINPSVCDRGFHFCKNLVDCFNYYSFDPDNKVAEIEALGAISEGDDKCCTNKIKIVKEITWHEVLELVNIGKGNTGLGNTGSQFRSMAPRGSQPFKNCIENYVSVKFISLYLIILKNTRMKRERVIFSVYYR